MTINILHLDKAEDQSLYQEILEKAGKKNAYFSLDFLRVFAEGLEHAVCFYAGSGQQLILMIQYIRPIPDTGGLKDTISPYGYAGPMLSGIITEDALAAFWEAVDDWYRKHNVVSEFIRFSLNGNSSGYNGQVIQTMSNIKGKIIDKDLQWQRFDRKVRKNVNRANEEKLTTVIHWGNDTSDEQLDAFHHIYIKTMERTNAKAKFFYTPEDFRNFRNKNPELCAFVFVMDQDICISAEMLLYSENAVYSFLGGTLDEYFNKRPNDLLKYEVINWARDNHIDYFVLGGGYGADDGIFKYKKAFFPEDVVWFETGRKILNTDLYEKLVSERVTMDDAGKQEISGRFFPLYRYTAAN